MTVCAQFAHIFSKYIMLKFIRKRNDARSTFVSYVFKTKPSPQTGLNKKDEPNFLVQVKLFPFFFYFNPKYIPPGQR